MLQLGLVFGEITTALRSKCSASNISEILEIKFTQTSCFNLDVSYDIY